MTDITRAEVCVTAIADLFRGDGEITASPMGLIPSLGGRLARLTFAPDLLLSDGEAYLIADAANPSAGIEGWQPFKKVLDVVVPNGKRHVIMGASQIDRYGNQNLSAFGSLQQPKRQMFGVRGAPGNTINHPTSYWVARHSARVFSDSVDIVCGVGYDKVDTENPAFDDLNIHRVVTNLGVFDFGGPGHTMRALSVHPGVTPDEVAENTGFEVAGLADAPATRQPTAEELTIIRDVLDPRGVRNREVK